MNFFRTYKGLDVVDVIARPFGSLLMRCARRVSSSTPVIFSCMANPEHLAKLKEGVKAWNKWRKQQQQVVLRGAYLHATDLRRADLTDTDLRKADLTGAYLMEADLSRANLGGADLTAAFLIGANVGGATLNGADLSAADLGYSNLHDAKLNASILTGTDLSGANLNGADLHGATLTRANLHQANLNLTNFSEAYVYSTIFGDVDLSTTRGLDATVHGAPSTIGLDTIYKSGGKIPEAFLRGAGVPEPFIIHMRSLVEAMEPIQFYSCFISYSSKDKAFAERLHADMRAKGLRCWFAPEDLKIGDHFQEKIEESVRVFDKVMIVLSESSVQSRWVEREVNAAWEREDRHKRTVLFPIRIDDAVTQAPQPWAADIRRQRHIGDFSGWKDDDSYRKAFERLLRDLKAETVAPGPGLGKGNSERLPQHSD